MKTLDLSNGPVPIQEWDWAGNGMELQYLTCKNHTDLRWLTKHPGMRNLHYLGHVDGSWVSECPCPINDLRVIGKEKK